MLRAVSKVTVIGPKSFLCMNWSESKTEWGVPRCRFLARCHRAVFRMVSRSQKKVVEDCKRNGLAVFFDVDDLYSIND
jgi:hypothetical protein